MSRCLKRVYPVCAFMVLFWVILSGSVIFAQTGKYQVIRVPFTVLDKDNRPFSGCLVGVRLDPSSPNPPEDETVSEGEIFYRVGDPYKKYGPTNGKGKVEIPFIVYRDKEDCIGYELAVFLGKEQDPSTKKDCLSSGKTVSTIKSSWISPRHWTTWFLYGLLFLVFVMIGVFFYRLFYKWQLKRSDNPQKVDTYRDRAILLFLFIVAVVFWVMFYQFLPHNLLMWIVLIVLTVILIFYFVFAIVF